MKAGMGNFVFKILYWSMQSSERLREAVPDARRGVVMRHRLEF
ncbi:hypothetical protein [Methylobacterium platani]|nr:hypothetical protein [Methylobacterium platani]